LGLGLA